MEEMMVVRDAEAAGAEEKGRYGAANETRRRELPEGGQADGGTAHACTHGTHAKRADGDVGRAGGLSVRSDPHSAAPGAHALGALAEAHNDMRAQGDASQPATLSDFQPKSCTKQFRLKRDSRAATRLRSCWTANGHRPPTALAGRAPSPGRSVRARSNQHARFGESLTQRHRIQKPASAASRARAEAVIPCKFDSAGRTAACNHQAWTPCQNKRVDLKEHRSKAEKVEHETAERNEGVDSVKGHTEIGRAHQSELLHSVAIAAASVLRKQPRLSMLVSNTALDVTRGARMAY
ncbi:hypothetical protein L1887_58831 [Cichorium endivia]|nr:hypothetical protein L1887_58831 [Cichorium endivia]